MSLLQLSLPRGVCCARWRYVACYTGYARDYRAIHDACRYADCLAQHYDIRAATI